MPRSVIDRDHKSMYDYRSPLSLVPGGGQADDAGGEGDQVGETTACEDCSAFHHTIPLSYLCTAYCVSSGVA